MPTLCYWVSGTCTTCDAWYSEHIASVAEGVVYILCCFALAFVLTYEKVFNDYLKRIEPYFKFWGVKLVVTVTYLQSLALTWWCSTKSEA